MRPAGWAAPAALALALAAPAPAREPPRGAARPAPLLTPMRLLGRWGDNGDCSKLVIFRGDGTFRASNGGEGTWRLSGERLTVTGGNGSTVLIVRLLDNSRLRLARPDGSVGISQRC